MRNLSKFTTSIASCALWSAALGLAACGSSSGAATAVDSAGSGDAGSGDAPSAADGDASGEVAAADVGSDATASAALSADVNAFCEPWVAWACQRALQCGCSTPKQGALSAATCASAAKAACAKDTAAVSGALAQGLAAIDPGEVKACLAWLDQHLPACVLGGLNAMGPGPCRTWLVQLPGPQGQCASSALRCADGSACVDGKCGATPAAVGAACQGAGGCASLVCQASSGTCIAAKSAGDGCSGDSDCPLLHRCADGKCAAPVQAGQACQASDHCAPTLACSGGKCAAAPKSCTPSSDCGAGGGCLGEVFNSCQPKLAQGKACLQDSQCDDSTWCDPASQTCAALPSAGQPCANGVRCAAGLGCGDAGTCEPLPAAGKPCALGEFGPMLCAPGLVCKTDAMVCSEPPVAGAACNSHANCSPSAGKDPGALVCAFGPKGSTCVQRLPKGATCENDVCQAGLFCDFSSNSCAPVVASGGKCSAGNECGSDGACVPDDLGQLRCVPLPKQGEACMFECAAGLFCDKGMKNATCQPQACKLFYQLY